MTKKNWFVVLLLLLAANLLRPSHADQPPAYRERDIWAQDLVSSANLFTNSLTPLNRGSADGVALGPAVTSCFSTTYRFTIGIDPAKAATVLYLNIKNVAAGTNKNYALNSGVSLTPGQLYSFAFNGSSGFQYNFQVGTTTTVGVLTVDRSEGAN